MHAEDGAIEVVGEDGGDGGEPKAEDGESKAPLETGSQLHQSLFNVQSFTVSLKGPVHPNYN